MKFLLILLLATQDLPEYGEVVELKDKQKVYVASSEQQSRKYIINELKKHFIIVNSPDNAEFFLQYEVKTSTESRGRQRSYYIRSEMLAYTLNNGRKRILWADDETYQESSGFSLSRPNEINLTKNFIKALKKLKLLPTDRHHQ